MKTRQQVIDEYKNRQEKPEYTQIGIMPQGKIDGGLLFSDVSNLISWIEDGREWNEFDYVMNTRSKHARIVGWINKYISSNDE